ncbi:MAG: GrpB family protein [Marmoricola sp.]
MLVPYDPVWPVVAAERLADLRRVLDPLVPGCAFDHIGSTSVPGLTAKPLIDLQVRMPSIPDPEVLDPALQEIGFLPHAGSRPDSPGVHRDHPRGSQLVPHEVWEKRLFTAESPATVLHVRRSDSPWGRYTVMFRDWLRAHPDETERYGQMKQALAGEHADDPDFDDYTRAKTAYFDEVQPAFERWTETRA